MNAHTLNNYLMFWGEGRQTYSVSMKKASMTVREPMTSWLRK